jgi:hypothetical protein
MKKVIRLTEGDLIGMVKRVLVESSLITKIILEQSEDSSISCSRNVSKGADSSNVWKSMDPNKRNELLKSIQTTITQYIDKSKQEYIKWFENPLTIKKFKTPQERAVLKKLPSYLQNIKNINISITGPNGKSGVMAWVSPDKPTLINYNISQLHNGKNFYNQSIDDTTKHEMAHLIDYFFKKNGVTTYFETIQTNNQESYDANYLINDKDQYTRLNVLRGIIGAGPADTPSTLLNKFLNQVNSGKITSKKFNFSGASSKKPGLKQKNNLQAAKEVHNLLRESIFVDGKSNLNIEQLFSNFGINKGGTVYVSFDLLAQLNFTSKDMDKTYYFLKMTPQ